jgi:citrate synthase
LEDLINHTINGGFGFHMMPISKIDSTSNQLFFRGFNVAEFSSRHSFEAVLYLLNHGQFPSDEDLGTITKRMIELRSYYDDDVNSLFDLAWNLRHIMEDKKLSLHDTLLTFVAIAPLVVAKEYGQIQNRMIKTPSRKIGHAANFLWMTKGVVPNDTDLNDFETSLILHMDDPQNPSLSALQKMIKDGQTISDALLAALTSHMGKLHHGAGTEAMTMLEETREHRSVRSYLKRRLDSGGKIFGLGHRIYRGIDPRAVILREILKRRVLRTENEWLLDITDAVSREGRLLLSKQKGIDAFPNVDLYNAAVYFTLGFPPELNTSLFAVSRAAGWMAHILDYSKSEESS